MVMPVRTETLIAIRGAIRLGSSDCDIAEACSVAPRTVARIRREQFGSTLTSVPAERLSGTAYAIARGYWRANCPASQAARALKISISAMEAAYAEIERRATRDDHEARAVTKMFLPPQ